jgi:hypothetical protein
MHLFLRKYLYALHEMDRFVCSNSFDRFLFFTLGDIASKNIVVSGVESTGTNFGKPGYTHFVLSFFFIIFHFIPRLWAKRSNLLVVALNIAWAIRNYFIISMCREGECPEKQIGLWLVLLASVLILVAALFPDIN